MSTKSELFEEMENLVEILGNETILLEIFSYFSFDDMEKLVEHIKTMWEV